jgi:hypothetical protein
LTSDRLNRNFNPTHLPDNQFRSWLLGDIDRGMGYEDSGFVIRLIRSGVMRKDGRFATGVLHLWHAPNDRAHEARISRC